MKPCILTVKRGRYYCEQHKRYCVLDKNRTTPTYQCPMRGEVIKIRAKKKRVPKALEAAFNSVYTFTDTLRGILGKCGFVEGCKIARMLVHWKGEVERLVGTEGQRPVDVAANMHTAIDTLIEEDKRRSPDEYEKVRCSKGCAFCCELYVTVTEQEAELLVEGAKENGWEIDRARLEKQISFTDGKAWAAAPREERRCVFLAENGTCAVYEYRPMACRCLFVFSEPSECNVETSKHVWRLAVIEAEVATTAAITVLGTGSLAEMVRAKLGQSGVL